MSDPPFTPETTPPSFKDRAHRFWVRHRRLFWILHSVWALATGIVVIYLARERYGFVKWVGLFMLLTWASTLFFGKQSAEEAGEEAAEDAEEARKEAAKDARAAADDPAADSGDDADAAPPVLHEVTSYMTRIMYQETLFFLLPFYAYSTVFWSPNVAFLALLAVLALVSCLDLQFDRWLRESAVFGLIYFASVAFAALNLIIPMLWNLAPRWATPLAGILAVAGGVPLAWRAAPRDRWEQARLVVAAVGVLWLSIAIPSLVPPVPLRVQTAHFGASIDRTTLALGDTLQGPVQAASLPGSLIVLARVFAPSELPTRVRVEWRKDGETVRTSRQITLTAHEHGFRVWDSWRPEDGPLEPGTYEAIFLARGGRVFGKARQVVE